jgi:hypothetical protein
LLGALRACIGNQPPDVRSRAALTCLSTDVLSALGVPAPGALAYVRRTSYGTQATPQSPACPLLRKPSLDILPVEASVAAYPHAGNATSTRSLLDPRRWHAQARRDLLGCQKPRDDVPPRRGRLARHYKRRAIK